MYTKEEISIRTFSNEEAKQANVTFSNILWGLLSVYLSIMPPTSFSSMVDHYGAA
jgi:hypothetical protein